jgi:ketosteroid isomerase-like protein
MILLRFSGRNCPVPDALHCENGMKLQLALQHRLTQSVSSACWSARRIVSREIGMNMGTDDGMDVKALIDRWAKAVREGDKAGVRADHDSEMLMLDVPPPLLSRGLDEYMATWNRFLSWSDKPVAFDFTMLRSRPGNDVASATAIGRCAGTDPAGKHESWNFD